MPSIMQPFSVIHGGLAPLTGRSPYMSMKSRLTSLNQNLESADGEKGAQCAAVHSTRSQETNVRWTQIDLFSIGNAPAQ